MENELIELYDKLKELKTGGLLVDHIDEINMDCDSAQKKSILSALQSIANRDIELFNNIRSRFKRECNCSESTMKYIESICLNKSKPDNKKIEQIENNIANILFNHFDGISSRKHFLIDIKRKLAMLKIKDNNNILKRIDLLYKKKYTVSMFI